MYGMTREEAAEKALLYERLRSDLTKVKLYLQSTMPEGDVEEILRPVAWAIDYARGNRG